MKKIDSWLDIQRFVREASTVALKEPERTADVEVIAKTGAKRRARITRISRYTI